MTANPTHATLVADTVTTITLDKDYGAVEITLVSTAVAVYVSLDGTTAPVAGTAGFEVLPAVVGAKIRRKVRIAGVTVVKLISTGTPVVSVRGLPKIDDESR